MAKNQCKIWISRATGWGKASVMCISLIGVAVKENSIPKWVQFHHAFVLQLSGLLQKVESWLLWVQFIASNEVTKAGNKVIAVARFSADFREEENVSLVRTKLNRLKSFLFVFNANGFFAFWWRTVWKRAKSRCVQKNKDMTEIGALSNWWQFSMIFKTACGQNSRNGNNLGWNNLKTGQNQKKLRTNSQP